jgi:molecular chaperone GrpE
MNGWADDEHILTCFRQWLREARSEAEALYQAAERGEGEEPEGEDGEPAQTLPAGLLQLVQEFTALRHEVKLQTKSARTLEEQAGAAVSALYQAALEFRSVEAQEAEAAQRAAAPLVQTLIDLDEAVRRCREVLESARRRIAVESVQRLGQRLEEARRGQSWWRRWLGRRAHGQTLDVVSQENQVQRAILESLVEGYGLLQNRLQRTLLKEGIARMECLGKVVDPNRMTVVEVVEDATAPPGHVLQEVRPGYTWKDKVFQFAEVRAARGGMTISQESESGDPFDGNDSGDRSGDDQQ